MRTKPQIILLLVASTAVLCFLWPDGTTVHAGCDDPGGNCGLCPCEGACYFHLQCAPGSYCRPAGIPSGCGCFYRGNGEWSWTVTGDIAGRCTEAGVSPGDIWFDTRIVGVLPGQVFGEALAINNHSQVLGFSDVTVVIWEDGLLTEVPGTWATGDIRKGDINDCGQVAFTSSGNGNRRGTYFVDQVGGPVVHIHDNLPWGLQLNDLGQVLIWPDRDTRAQGVLWKDGVTTPLSALTDPPIYAAQLNNRGHLGGAVQIDGKWRASLLMDGKVVELDDESVPSGGVHTVNDLDQAVFNRGGDPLFDPDFQMFFWDKGSASEISNLAPCYPSWVWRMNNCGEMILELEDALDTPECAGEFPFSGAGYYSPQTGYRPITKLFEDVYRWDDVYLYEINDRGQIVGSALVVANGESGLTFLERGFVVSPMPGDFTLDGSVDLNDYPRFFERFGHPTTDYSILCNRADFDEDADTDLHDFATFQNLFSGQ